MKIPINLRILASLAGVNAAEFANGWGEGLFRWNRRNREGAGGEVPSNPLPLGTVRRAASAAAVAFMRELKND